MLQALLREFWHPSTLWMAHALRSCWRSGQLFSQDSSCENEPLLYQMLRLDSSVQNGHQAQVNYLQPQNYRLLHQRHIDSISWGSWHVSHRQHFVDCAGTLHEFPFYIFVPLAPYLLLGCVGKGDLMVLHCLRPYYGHTQRFVSTSRFPQSCCTFHPTNIKWITSFCLHQIWEPSCPSLFSHALLFSVSVIPAFYSWASAVHHKLEPRTCLLQI